MPPIRLPAWFCRLGSGDRLGKALTISAQSESRRPHVRNVKKIYRFVTSRDMVHEQLRRVVFATGTGIQVIYWASSFYPETNFWHGCMPPRTSVTHTDTVAAQRCDRLVLLRCLHMTQVLHGLLELL